MTIAQTQNTAEQLLRDAGILPVVTVDTLDQARRVADALLEGGLPAIELTLRTPIAIEALAMLKRELPNIVIGAGTVLSELQLR
ncbi:2-dehydro-3-deoxyphosphogluconate aldolase, partial [Xanthomonas hortorum pv. gardneri]